MKRRRTRSTRARGGRRTIEISTYDALDDFQQTLKKAACVCAAMFVLGIVAKNSGGIDLPLNLTLNLQEDRHSMSTDTAPPGPDTADVLLPPSTIRLTQKLKDAIGREQVALRTTESAAIRRVLERGLCAPLPSVPILEAPDSTTRDAIEALGAAIETLRNENKILCDLVRTFHTDLDRGIEGQNQLLNLVVQAMLGILETLDPEHVPSEQVATLKAYVRKNLRFRDDG